MRGHRLGKPDWLTFEYIRKWMNYDPLTGVVVRHDGVVIGDKESGRGQILINGIRITTTRLIWFYMKNEWPELSIDHEDTDIHNNRWLNLRQITHGQNQMNRKIQKNKISRFKGVKLKHGKWYCYVVADNVVYSGGYHEDEEIAARVRDELARQHHGHYARLNFPIDGEKSVRYTG